MLLDHVIMCFVIAPPLIVIGLIFKSDDPFVISPVESFAFFFMMLIYFNKDFFNAQSVAKRILGLQIIDRKTSQPATDLKCFLRNITIPIWPLEALISLVSPTRRLGDLIANTRVEKADKKDVILIFADLKNKTDSLNSADICDKFYLYGNTLVLHGSSNELINNVA